MTQLDISTKLERLGGQPVAYDLSFRSDDVLVRKTLRFRNAAYPSVHLYIGVDAAYVPVCMSLVHPPDLVQYKQIPKSDESEIAQLADELFAFARTMAALCRDATAGARGIASTRTVDELIGPTTERMRQMESVCA